MPSRFTPLSSSFLYATAISNDFSFQILACFHLLHHFLPPKVLYFFLCLWLLPLTFNPVTTSPSTPSLLNSVAVLPCPSRTGSRIPLRYHNLQMFKTLALNGLVFPHFITVFEELHYHIVCLFLVVGETAVSACYHR